MELNGDWIDDEEALSPEEKRLIESRLAEHDADPSSAVPWEEVKARLKALFAK
jgi:putative addiction module component (TIGR02574 family)